MLGATRIAFFGASSAPVVLLDTQTYTTSGAHQYTVLSGTTYIYFEVTGGGGGGGGKYNYSIGRSSILYGGGGGGGGGYVNHTYTATFTGGDIINMIVGIAGAGNHHLVPNTSYHGFPGGTSEITNHTKTLGSLVTIGAYAFGGLGGRSIRSSSVPGGTGGTGSGNGDFASGTNGTTSGESVKGGDGGAGASGGGVGGAGSLLSSPFNTPATNGTAPGGGGGGGGGGGLYDDGEDGAIGTIILKAYGYT